MDFSSYIENAKKPDNFEPTGITKDNYLDVIEICVNAYDKQSLIDRLPDDGGMVDDIHAYSRIACGIAALLSNGRLPGYHDLWISMMDALCNDFYRQIPPNTLDFALKETMLGFKAMKPFVSIDKQEYWLELLGRIDPFKSFSNQYPYHEWDRVRNWNIYSMAGLWLLETEGGTDSSAFFDKYWDHQLKYFDENGMYMDPYNPILYDITTRVQAQLIPAYGYRGKYYMELDGNLQKGALMSLFSQSAASELPFGGRSNQFLFNESLLTSNFEYEAARWKKKGNLKLAGMYKRASKLAIQSIEKWLNAPDGARHIKNLYPTESKFGTESYGYYDKYMMTMGVFLFIGIPFSDESIEEFPCPAELGGYVFETTPSFHKVFANCGSYSIELDTGADFFYDATGLGRIHRKGAPTELALSASSGELHDKRYPTPGALDTAMALSPGWEEDGEMVFLGSFSRKENHSFSYIKDDFDTPEEFEEYINGFRHGLETELKIISQTHENVTFDMKYSGSAAVTERYSIAGDGVKVKCSLDEGENKKIYYLLPAFITNGSDTSTIVCSGKELTVSSMGWTYTVKTDGKITKTDDLLGNRNGLYKRYIASGDGSSISLEFTIERNKED